MATVTAAGVTGRTMAEYITDLQGVFRDALGLDLDLAAETPQSQIIAALGRVFAETDAAIVAVGSRSFPTAVGYQLDDYGALLDLRRQQGTHTQTQVVIGGDVGATIRSDFALRDANGNRYLIYNQYWSTNEYPVPTDISLRRPTAFIPNINYDVDAVVRGTDGQNYIATRDIPPAAAIGPGWERFPHAASQYARFIAVNRGAFYVPFDGLSIVSPTLGIDAVYNKTIGVTGRNPESDEEYRRRFAYAIARNSGGTAQGIIAALTDGLPSSYLQGAYLLENTATERDLTRTIPGGIHPGDPLVGGVVTATVAEIVAAEAAITSGNALSFPAHPGDVPHNRLVQIPANIIDFSGVTTFDGIATALKAAIISGVDGAVRFGGNTVVQYDAAESRFLITFTGGILGTGATLYHSPRIAADSPLADIMGLSAAGGAIADYIPGCAIVPILDWGQNTAAQASRYAATATAIVARSKPAGVRTYGALGASPGFYTNVNPISLSVQAIITTDADFPADGVQRMQNELANYINGLGLQTPYSEQAMWGRLYRVSGWTWGNNAADAVPGTDFVVTGGVTALNLISRYTLSSDAVTITVI